MNASWEDETPITVVTGAPALNVLIIDGDEHARVSAARALSEAGSRVFELSTADGVTAYVLGHRIEVVILDLATAETPPDRLIRSLRRNPLLARLGLLLTSSWALEDFDVAARTMGADGFVRKHASALELALAVRRARNRRNGR